MEFMDWGPLIVKIKRDSGTGYEYCPLTIKKEGKGKTATIKYLPTMIEYYNRWVNEVESCGYGFDYRTLNAADYGAYTSRKRFFGIFAKKRLPIVFPEPTHSKEAQHTLFGPLKRWIFDRPCPLSPNTLDRHKAGLIKFVAGGKEKYIKKRAFLKLQTEISGHIPGMKNVQFLSKYFSGHPESKNISILGPAHTFYHPIMVMETVFVQSICLVRPLLPRIASIRFRAISLICSMVIVTVRQWKGLPELLQIIRNIAWLLVTAG